MTSSPKRKICVVLVDRANYGRMKPVMEAIRSHPQLELQIVAAGTLVLERFDLPVEVIRADGFRVDSEIFLELEGSNPATMAKSVGFGVVEFSGEFRRLNPDIVLLIGDRYEAVAAAIAAAYMNFCIAHIQGGEVSGSIDESARHAISKFAHFHFPSTERAAYYLTKMGERPDTILAIGCPSSDLSRTLDRSMAEDIVNRRGSGATINLQDPYLLVVFHPTTTEYGGERGQIDDLLEALRQLAEPTLLLWPNIDAGSDHVSKSIRRFRDQKHTSSWLRTIINLAPEDYLRVLAGAACAVGNSSSFVRDAGFFGTPVVLVGNRQAGREMDSHVVRVQPVADQIVSSVARQLAHGRYQPSTLYGDGHVAPRIVDALANAKLYVQKQLNYIHEEEVGSEPAGPGEEACASLQ